MGRPVTIIGIKIITPLPTLARECGTSLINGGITFVDKLRPPGMITAQSVFHFRILNIQTVLRAVELIGVFTVFGLKNIVSGALFRFILNGIGARVILFQPLPLLLGPPHMLRIIEIKGLHPSLILFFRKRFIKKHVSLLTQPHAPKTVGAHSTIIQISGIKTVL